MKEDFVCDQCGAPNTGTGYTNHCAHCLWSKHVDVAPGDRAATCGGRMRPVRLEGTAARYRILHRCEKCGHEKMNDAAENDSPEALVELARIRARGVV